MSDTEIIDPPWLTEGARVAVVNQRNRLTHVVFDTIIRLTKRDVVLADHGRFPRAHLSRRNGGTWDGTTYLRDPDAPDVIDAWRAERRDTIIRKGTADVDAILRSWRNPGSTDEPAESAVAILGALLERIRAVYTELPRA